MRPQDFIESAREAAIIATYFKICQDFYPDDFESIQDMTIDTIYTSSQIYHACSEVAYIQEHNAMPLWATVIDSFVMVDGAYVFTHRDKRTS